MHLWQVLFFFMLERTKRLMMWLKLKRNFKKVCKIQSNLKWIKESKRDQKEEDKNEEINNKVTTKKFWINVKNEKVNIHCMQEYQNRVLLNLADRYFDFTQDFDGNEKNFKPINVIWIRWWKREALAPSQESWKQNKIIYLDNKFDITLGKIAETLTDFGDISIVKDSWVTAFIQFSSFDFTKFNIDTLKGNVFENEYALKLIQKRLEEETILFVYF